MGRGRPGGNPALGKDWKYAFKVKGSEPLSKKPLHIRVAQSNYDELMEIPSDERLELVREAIAKALAERKEKLHQTSASAS